MQANPPCPPQSKVLTAVMFAALATPKSEPAEMEARAVPWPAQSVVLSFESMLFHLQRTKTLFGVSFAHHKRRRQASTPCPGTGHEQVSATFVCARSAAVHPDAARPPNSGMLICTPESTM